MMVTNRRLLKKILKLTYGRQHFSWRRAAFMTGILPIATGLYGLDKAGRAIDELFFSEFEDQPVGEPIFIMSSPRSGTTLLHRLMSLDSQFTSMKLWQTMMPTISIYRIVQGIEALDKKLGNLLSFQQEKFAEDAFAMWDGIHRTRFDESEEDEASFVLALATPSVWMGVPFIEELEELAYVDRTPFKKQLVEYFRGTIQRHLYATKKDGESKILLAKNVFLAGRLGVVEEAAPNSRYVQIIRHPYRTLASCLSFFTAPWEIHSPEIPKDGEQVRLFAEICMEYALTVHRFMEELPPERGITIYYEDLIKNPEAEIQKIYDQFGLEFSETFRAHLKHTLKEERDYKSGHAYSLDEYGLTKDFVYENLAEIFEAHNLPRNIDEDDLN